MTIEPTTSMSSPPLDGLLERYRIELEQQGYSQTTVKTYLRVVQKLCQRIDVHGLDLAGLTPDRAAELIQRGAGRGKHTTYEAFIARRFAAFLLSLGMAEPPALTPRELTLKLSKIRRPPRTRRRRTGRATA